MKMIGYVLVTALGLLLPIGLILLCLSAFLNDLNKAIIGSLMCFVGLNFYYILSKSFKNNIASVHNLRDYNRKK